MDFASRIFPVWIQLLICLGVKRRAVILSSSSGVALPDVSPSAAKITINSVTKPGVG